MKSYLFKIEALTNMHPGSGDNNFGVVDNMVQRDPATNLPVIHGSSLKGAIKEFFGCEDNSTDAFCKQVFGDGDNSGLYRFLPAQLLAIPLRSTHKPYYMATSPGVIRQFLDLAEKINISLPDTIKRDLEYIAGLQPGNPKVTGIVNNLIIEDYEQFDNLDRIQRDTLEFLGATDNNLLVLSDKDFVQITDQNNLPVVARNKLVNGKSDNLWYEQVIPRFTVFVMPLIATDDESLWNKFKDEILGKPVQIGGNASVGYGFTRFTLI